MRHKLIATVLGVGLIGLAAVGAFASQDAVRTNVDPPTVASTGTPEATHTPKPAKTEHAHAADADDAADGTEGPEATRTIKGIPTDNPNHHPDNGDGICQKGETAIKTTPSGVQVNVPCQAASHTNNGNHRHNGTPEADETETPDD